MGCCNSAGPKVVAEPAVAKLSLREVFDRAHLLRGNAEALEWCLKEKLEDASAIDIVEERLSSELGLTVLERKRLLLSVGSDREVFFDALPDHQNKSSCVEAPVDITLNLRVRTLSGSVLGIFVKSSDSILVAKTQIRESDDFLKDKQFVLISDGSELRNHWSVLECGLARTAELHLSLREACKHEVEGFFPLLQQAELAKYRFEFTFCLGGFGAIHLDEVREHAVQVADAVGLRGSERERFFSVLDVEEFIKLKQAAKEEEAKSKAGVAAEAQFQQWLVQHPDIIAPKELEGCYCVCNVEPVLNITFPGWCEWIYSPNGTNGKQIEVVCPFLCVAVFVAPLPGCPLFCNNLERDRDNPNHYKRGNGTMVKRFHRSACGICSHETGERSTRGVLVCPRSSRSSRHAARDKFQRELYGAPVQQSMRTSGHAHAKHGWQ